MLKKGRIVPASVLLALLGILLASCGGDSTNIPPKQNQVTYNYQTPAQSGGTLLYSDWQFPDSDNPLFSTSAVDDELLNALYGQPFVVTSDGRLLPDQLAEIPTQANGDVSKDGLIVTLKLNPNLKWSDGQPLTSADFMYYIKTLLDPATGAPSTTGFDPHTLASYTAPDAHTLILKYAKVFTPFLFYLPYALPEHAWGNIPNKALMSTQDVNLAPTVTSGPYMVQDYADGQSITMVPNKFYASTSLHPTTLNKLVFKGYQSKNALITGYEAGQTDHAEGFTVDDLPSLKRLPGLQVTPATEYEHLDPNLANPVLRDLNVRKAIEQAINRCQMIQSLLQQPCNKLSVNQLEPPPNPDSDPSIKELPFDLKAAKNDMKAAGWDCSSNPCTKNGQPFPTLNLVTTNSSKLRQDATQIIKADLAKLGIPINLDHQYYPAASLFGNYSSNGILATGKYDLALFAYSPSLDSDRNLYPSFDSSQIPSVSNPAGQNYSQVQDPKVDKLLEEGRTTIDPSKRSNVYKQLQKYLIQQVYSIPLYLRPNITLTNGKLGNYFPNPITQENEWDIGEWWQRGAHGAH
jgi:peptide/nickel transport system substrate-binding protein